MVAAFPNQIPFVLADDSPSRGSSKNKVEPHTPEMPHPPRALFDLDDKDSLGLSPHLHAVIRTGACSDEGDAATDKKGLKQLNEMFASREGVAHSKLAERRIIKGLHFQEEEGKSSEDEIHNRCREVHKHKVAEKEDTSGDNKMSSMKEEISQLSAEKQNLKMQVISESERADKANAEVQSLRQTLSKLQGEKEAGLIQYQQCLERMSNMECEISHADDRLRSMKEEISQLSAENQNLKMQVMSESERADKANAKVQSLRQALSKLQGEKEAGLIPYQQCLERMSNMECEISRADNKMHNMKEEISQLSAKNQNLKMQVMSESERADKANAEVRSLRQTLSKLQGEKESGLIHYQQCLERMSNMESEISLALEEVSKLNGEMLVGVVRLNIVEERCLLLEKANQSLKSEVDSLVQKTSVQQQELLEKNEERVLALEFQRSFQVLTDMELRVQCLEGEVQQIKEDNNRLNEHNLFSAASIKHLQDDVFSLKQTEEKLEEEVGLHVDQRNTLQQELYCLKQEINDLNAQHVDVVEQIESVGLNMVCFCSSVKDLQDENSKLKETCEKDRIGNMNLLAKLGKMEELWDRNLLLENSLSDLHVELGVSGEKLKALEESCQSLHAEKSSLLVEKDTLVSCIESIMKNMEKLSGKSMLLENSLSDANFTLEGLTEKLSNLEESFQSLHIEKSSLLSERDGLISQVEGIRQAFESLEKRYVELEDKWSRQEMEKEMSLHRVGDLLVLLKLEKQGHASFIQSSNTQIGHLENQLHLLQKEGRQRKKEFEEEQDKVMNAQVEISVLQTCICDMKERSLCMSMECQKHIEASAHMEEHISELEQENFRHQIRVKSLLEDGKKQRIAIRLAFELLDIDMDDGSLDRIEDQVVLQNILGKIREIQSSVLHAQDEKQQLLFEKTVNDTLLQQLSLDVFNLKLENYTLKRESRFRIEELLTVKSEKNNLLELKEHLSQEVQAGNQREGVLKAEMEILDGQLSDLCEAQQSLQDKNFKLLEENHSSTKELCDLRVEKYILEEDKNEILKEAIALGNLSLIFERFSTEKTMELERINHDLDYFRGVKNGFEKEVRVLIEMIKMADKENLHLTKSTEKLEEYKSRSMILEEELNKIRNVSEELNHQIEIGNSLLTQKEIELAQADQRLEDIQSRNIALHRDVEGLQQEYFEAKVIREELEKQIFMLSEDKTLQTKEMASIREGNEKLERELVKLYRELEELRSREAYLNSEMVKKTNEVELLEVEAATLYDGLQISAMRAVLFEEKVRELFGTCESLQKSVTTRRKLYDNETTSRNIDMDGMKKKLNILEEENETLKAELTAYPPLILSLKDSITSLEGHTNLLTKIHAGDSLETQDAASVGHPPNMRIPSEDHCTMMLPVGVLELQKFQTKVQTVEKMIMGTFRLMIQENAGSNIKLEAAMKEIEELKLKHSKELELQKNEVEISKVKYGIAMKDIPLDHISDSSSGYGVHLYQACRRKCTDKDDPMLELWETAERETQKLTSEASADGTLEYHHIDAVEVQAENELAVDIVEIPEKVPESYEEAKKRVMERLSSDAQRLSNLQKAIQEIKMKMDKSDNANQSTSFEYDSISRQLKEVEEAVLQLVDITCKLTKKAEGGAGSTSDSCNFAELEEMVKMRNLQISRSESIKIGRLELEVQRIQFVLIKLEEERERKGKRGVERTIILLREYLYHGKDGHKRKKIPFCGCIRPSTKGD